MVCDLTLRLASRDAGSPLGRSGFAMALKIRAGVRSPGIRWRTGDRPR